MLAIGGVGKLVLFHLQWKLVLFLRLTMSLVVRLIEEKDLSFVNFHSAGFSSLFCFCFQTIDLVVILYYLTC